MNLKTTCASQKRFYFSSFDSILGEFVVLFRRLLKQLNPLHSHGSLNLPSTLERFSFDVSTSFLSISRRHCNEIIKFSPDSYACAMFQLKQFRLVSIHSLTEWAELNLLLMLSGYSVLYTTIIHIAFSLSPQAKPTQTVWQK